MKPDLNSAFGLEKNHVIYLIGGGGKTSLMFALARSLAALDRQVITTTSTKINVPEEQESERVLIAPIHQAIDLIQNEFQSWNHLTIASAQSDEGKLLGFTPQELDRLSPATEYLLVEADGSAGRSLKAHAEYEPVLSGKADLVIAVIGVDCIGKPLNDQFVHRSGLFSQRSGLAPGAKIEAQHVAGLFFHPDGYLKKVPSRTEVKIFLSHAGSPERRKAAVELAEMLRTKDLKKRVERILMGEIGNTGINLITP